jgi:branched-chain amino acid transport system substrate-binding protein
MFPTGKKETTGAVRTRSRFFGAALAGLSLVAAACGGDDGDSGDGASTEGTVDQGVNQGVNDALSGTTAAGGTTDTTAGEAQEHPDSMEAWEALWEEERQAMVDRIKENGWGLSADGATITGPEGFTIDMSKCPGGWNNTEGLTDTEIKIGQAIAQSGTLAVYGQIAKGISVHLAKLNAAGGVTDSEGKTRMYNYVAKDDGYDPARTIPLVDELIDSEKVFAVMTLGSPNTMKVYDKLNQRCIPNPLAMTGHPAWGDPVNHPWTTGEQLAYNTEAVLWGAFLEENADELKANDGKITVAALVMNNDFGKAYDGGFQAWLAQSPMKGDIEYESEVIEPTAPTITDAMTTLASKSPEVFIAMTAGTSCTQAITEAAQNGLKESAMYLFQPSVCKGNSFVGKEKVGGDGSVSDGWWVVGGGLKPADSPALDGDPWVKSARAELEAGGVDWHAEPTALAGSRFAWTVEQTFNVAAQLDGGLTRANFIVALRSFDMTAPFLLEGARFNMNGNADAYLTEASEFSTYNASTQGWDQEGELIELSGKSSNCAFNQSTATCA